MDKQLADLIPALGNKPVLVVGDVMLDHYIHGEVRRMAPESSPSAPVPVLSALHESFILGGAGGVVANINGLGARALVLGMVADDSAGAKITSLLEQAGADIKFLTVAKDRPSIVKMRFMKGTEQLLRTDYETVKPLSDADEKTLIANIPAALQDCGAVILSDYAKGVLSAAVIQAVIKQAHQQNIPVLVDPKGKDFTIYDGADYITPNAKELSEATGLPTDTQEQVLAAAQALRAVTNIKTIIAKRSEQGMSVVSAAPPLHLPATAQHALGVAGAGDTVIATLAVALASGLPIAQAAALANEAAGIIVAKPGTTPIEKAELLATLSGERHAVDTTREAPVFSHWAAARAQVEAWKAQGLTVGFTNGCFDILHYGHVNYLNRARERCDRFIVGLNADASITRLKGVGRPVHEELSRAAVLAALGAVDMVAIFGNDAQDDDKPIRLIEALQPDVCFKGGDYKVEDLPEAKIVLAYGGRFEIMPMYEGHSTTNAIRKMQKTG